MLVIRLSRTGRKKQPYYRVVVADKRSAVKTSAIEVLGHYNPRTKELKLDADRAKARLADGAQPSETAEALLEKAGILKRDAITEKNRRPERQKRKAAEPEGAAPTAKAAEGTADEAPTEEKAEEAPTEEAKTADKPPGEKAEKAAEPAKVNTPKAEKSEPEAKKDSKEDKANEGD